ncbi:resolvase [Bacillus phage Shanette]|uniref:Resolvase n=1 Tax=Bacillus phage Shanette TaxID=1296656 RepID=S5M963_9CAUD|nr:RusA-like Holliday junction resolvase [Bacillus phage Shanette]AGR47038.1 resolvase [Bacillus phage Shanette]
MKMAKTGGKGINSKNKGAEYERKIAKALGSWWGEQFQRTPASGGLQWKKDNRVTGDIVTPPESVFPFTIECKKREGWSLEQFLKNTGEMEEWWTQCIRDAAKIDKKPMVIFSKNFDTDYVLMDLEDFSALTLGKEPFNHFAVSKVGLEPRVICELDKLIANVSKEDVIKAYSL